MYDHKPSIAISFPAGTLYFNVGLVNLEADDGKDLRLGDDDKLYF